MDKEYIINGKRYVLAEEEKKPERLEGWIIRRALERFKDCILNEAKTAEDDTRMVEIKPGEVIVSREQIFKAIRKYFPVSETWVFDDVLKELGL